MKPKELMYLLVAVTIFLAVGYVAYTQLLAPKKSAAQGVAVEVVGKIPSSLSDSGMKKLNDTNTVKDFSSPVDLQNLGNPAPFGN